MCVKLTEDYESRLETVCVLLVGCYCMFGPLSIVNKFCYKRTRKFQFKVVAATGSKKGYSHLSVKVLQSNTKTPIGVAI